MRYYGVVIDHSFTRWSQVDNFLLGCNTHDAIITIPNTGVGNKLTDLVDKYDLHYYCMDAPKWDVYSKKTNDELFLHYLRLHKAPLYLFVHKYNTKTYGKHYAKRFQDLLITAHILGVKVEVTVDDSDDTASIRSDTNQDTERRSFIGTLTTSVSDKSRSTTKLR